MPSSIRQRSEVGDVRHLAGNDGAGLYRSQNSSQGFFSSCLMPRENFSFSTSTFSTTASISWPSCRAPRGALRDASGDVRDVHEPVDALFDADKDPEVRDVADAAPDDGPLGVLLLEGQPGIGRGLLEAREILLLSAFTRGS